MSEEFLWVEKHRPHTIDECILPQRLKDPFYKYVADKVIPNMILSGGPGVGKTTVARALCEEIGLNHMVINASKERGIDTLRTKITNYASTVAMKGGRKVIILDEADNLTSDAQLALRGSIEEFSKNCTFILTCNFKAKIMEAIHSRAPNIDFKLENSEKPEMAKQFFKRVESILKSENIQYDKAVVAKIVEKYFPDYRRTLGELQHLSTFGNIDAGVLAHISDVRKLKELYSFLKGKKFTEMRKWVVENSDVDHNTVFRAIFETLNDFLDKASVPQAILIIAKYQYQAAFVADQEINTVAMLTELMVDCEYV